MCGVKENLAFGKTNLKQAQKYHCEVFPLQVLSQSAERNREAYLQFKWELGQRGHFFLQGDVDQIRPLGYNVETTQAFANASVYIKS